MCQCCARIISHNHGHMYPLNKEYGGATIKKQKHMQAALTNVKYGEGIDGDDGDSVVFMGRMNSFITIPKVRVR